MSRKAITRNRRIPESFPHNQNTPEHYETNVESLGLDGNSSVRAKNAEVNDRKAHFADPSGRPSDTEDVLAEIGALQHLSKQAATVSKRP
eukprot:4762384-Amphidinium_carterae.1